MRAQPDAIAPPRAAGPDTGLAGRPHAADRDGAAVKAAHCYAVTRLAQAERRSRYKTWVIVIQALMLVFAWWRH